LPLPPPLDGTHIEVFRLIIQVDALVGWCQANLKQDLLEASTPPDEDLVDLIEGAFLEGQIDGQKADLAYLWLWMYETTSRFAQICA
jgi:hypothetical protein